MTELCTCGAHRARGHVGSWAWCRRNRGNMGAGGRAGVGDLAYGGGQGWRGEVDDVLRESFSLPAIIHARCDGSSRPRSFILLFAVVVARVLVRLGGRWCRRCLAGSRWFRHRLLTSPWWRFLLFLSRQIFTCEICCRLILISSVTHHIRHWLELHKRPRQLHGRLHHTVRQLLYRICQHMLLVHWFLLHIRGGQIEEPLSLGPCPPWCGIFDSVCEV